MPFNGSGVYTAPAADFPVVTQTVISSTHFNNTINDIATALSTCLTKDGQQTATANIPFGGFRATNVGITAIAGSVGTPAINVSDAATGLYRSAASELAVTVAGTQVARFASTGLIVTGAASVSTTLTASTSVVTPLVAAPAGTSLSLASNGATSHWVISGTTADLTPGVAQDNSLSFGSPSLRIKQAFTPIIDTGTTGSGSLKTNNGTTVLTWANSLLVTLAGNLTVSGGTVGTGAASDLIVTTSGGTQAQFVHTASSTRWVTIAGSNGGNPTISTTAGSLAITPLIAAAGGIISAGDVTITSKRFKQAAGANIGGANNLTLGGDGNVFALTGSTQVNLLDNTSWQDGSVVILIGSTLTIKHNQAASGTFRPILLSGSADYVMSGSANVLTLVFQGSANAWQEIARKNP